MSCILYRSIQTNWVRVAVMSSSVGSCRNGSSDLFGAMKKRLESQSSPRGAKFLENSADPNKVFTPRELMLRHKQDGVDVKDWMLIMNTRFLNQALLFCQTAVFVIPTMLACGIFYGADGTAFGLIDMIGCSFMYCFHASIFIRLNYLHIHRMYQNCSDPNHYCAIQKDFLGRSKAIYFDKELLTLNPIRKKSILQYLPGSHVLNGKKCNLITPETMFLSILHYHYLMGISNSKPEIKPSIENIGQKKKKIRKI